MNKTVTQIKKRDGRIVPFDKSRIATAIFKAAQSVGGSDRLTADLLANVVTSILNEKYDGHSIPTVEEVQDIVEKVLIEEGRAKTAKAYILYRDQHSQIRDLKSFVNSDEILEGYLKQTDWLVKENSNMTFSLQGLNNHVASAVSKHYWLHKIYPKEIREAHSRADFHIHDLQILAAYCCGWDLKDLLIRGFGGVKGKIESKPAKHLKSALGQIVNFFYTLQGETAGAQAFSNFDTYLAPFVKHDNLNYEQVKQHLQEFMFNMNVPTRVGFQTPFTNITMDLNPPANIADESIIIGGQPQKEKYGDFQTEMDMINKAFAEVAMDGDARGQVFTFPIPTYNITKNFDWNNETVEKIWEMTAKYGLPYFSNFINSDMKPEDARSMCCRLRLDNRELRRRGGGLFGANPLTGAIGVVTINLPRLGFLAQNEQKFFTKLKHLMDLAKQSLEIKREIMEKFTQAGLYPYAKHYLSHIKEHFGQYWKNHFNTIGLNGLNEACLNLINGPIDEPAGQELAKKVLDFMRETIMDYQNETGNIYNLEATPAEGATYRFAKTDKELYPAIICANEQAWQNKKTAPYYTNSSHLPVNRTTDIFTALDLQDELQTKYTGGTVLHGFIGEKLPNGEVVKILVRKIAENYKLPYFTLTPTFSICPSHNYIAGEYFKCPRCQKECEVYSRVVGYLRPVQQWNDGKQSEFYDREEYRIKKDSSEASIL